MLRRTARQCTRSRSNRLLDQFPSDCHQRNRSHRLAIACLLMLGRGITAWLELVLASPHHRTDLH